MRFLFWIDSKSILIFIWRHLFNKCTISMRVSYYFLSITYWLLAVYSIFPRDLKYLLFNYYCTFNSFSNCWMFSVSLFLKTVFNNLCNYALSSLSTILLNSVSHWYFSSATRWTPLLMSNSSRLNSFIIIFISSHAWMNCSLFFVFIFIYK